MREEDGFRFFFVYSIQSRTYLRIDALVLAMANMKRCWCRLGSRHDAPRGLHVNPAYKHVAASALQGARVLVSSLGFVTTSAAGCWLSRVARLACWIQQPQTRRVRECLLSAEMGRVRSC
jgi:hypothetical protein